MMKKQYYIVISLLLIGVTLSGCSVKQDNAPIKYNRRLEQYLPESNSKIIPKTVDLSEGPKAKYDARFGPKDLNFDIKIKNPY